MAPACRKPSPDFDFLLGIWKCRHRYLRRRLSGCNDWIEFDGSCAARRILDGYGNMDEADIDLPGDRGMSLRTYDPDRDRWSIHRLDSRRPGFLFPPVVGGFDKGIGTFYRDDEHDGRAIRVRFLWSPITPQSARWEQAFSCDEGTRWETNWTMDFARV